jgi:hypothetical protein
MRILKHSYAVVVVGTIAATVATSIAVGAVGGGGEPYSNNPPGTVIPVPPSRPQAPAISNKQAAAFAVMRGPARAKDLAPAAASRFVAAGLAKRYGVNSALARHGASAGAAGDVYLISGNGVLCLITVLTPGTGGGCVEDDAAAVGHLVGTDSWQTAVGAPEHVVVSGAVPDGIDTVTIKTADGATTDVAVQDNAYAHELIGKVPDTVSWKAADGSTHSEPIPYQAG